MLRVASLFSGAGGLDLGFAQAGYRIVFANDVLPHAVKTYAVNFGLKPASCGGRTALAKPGTVMECDVSLVDFSELGEVDVIVGGPPCQDFSVVRGPDWDRRGIEVERGRLYAHFVRALVALQPKAFVFENVPGLVSANKGLAYKVILEDFQQLNVRWEEVRRVVKGSWGSGKRARGYEVVFSDVVDFSALGVPQMRKRLIIIGVRRDLVRSIEELWRARSALQAALSGKRWLFRDFPLTPLEVLEGRPLHELQDVYFDVMREWEGVWEEVGTQKAWEWKKQVWDRLTFDVVEDYLILNGAPRTGLEEALKQHEEVLRELGYLGVTASSLRLPDGTTEVPQDGRDVAERMRRIPPGENHEFVRGTRWEVEGRGISLVYRRLHPLKPAPTVVAYGGGGTHGYHYRRARTTLTLRERARLQTFPDSFLFTGSPREIRAQIGEAVPPLAAKRLAETLEKLLSEFD